MSAAQYREALAAAIREYEELGARRRDLDDRLTQLAQTIGTLTRLLGLTPTVPLGMTDACRLALRGAGVPLTPVEVRDRLLSIGVDLSAYSNDLSVIHTTLKRLNESGDIRSVSKHGKPAYVWNHEVRTIAVKDRAEAVRRFKELPEAQSPARRGRKRS